MKIGYLQNILSQIGLNYFILQAKEYTKPDCKEAAQKYNLDTWYLIIVPQLYRRFTKRTSKFRYLES